MRSEESQRDFTIAMGDILRELHNSYVALSQLLPFLAPFEDSDPRTVHDEVEATKALAVVEQSHQHLDDIRTRCRAYLNTLNAIDVVQGLSKDNLTLKDTCKAKLAEVMSQHESVNRIHGKLRARVKRPYH
jgi:hypothetical protein